MMDEWYGGYCGDEAPLGLPLPGDLSGWLESHVPAVAAGKPRFSFCASRGTSATVPQRRSRDGQRLGRRRAVTFPVHGMPKPGCDRLSHQNRTREMALPSRSALRSDK
ncbi:hypothetical protein CYMTET_18986 [Cymbomonas tetramitiformis]|uniref:Uncharacterized protein n=1 Tax=Cymbomonas tetramitiformis TaxID=36881 RepID=A0AAE0L5T0_9CHLO|nr:hypothetical protein CYMTET_18986 [Cymbomonas tetramitiformis]